MFEHDRLGVVSHLALELLVLLFLLVLVFLNLLLSLRLGVSYALGAVCAVVRLVCHADTDRGA